VYVEEPEGWHHGSQLYKAMNLDFYYSFVVCAYITWGFGTEDVSHACCLVPAPDWRSERNSQADIWDRSPTSATLILSPKKKKKTPAAHTWAQCELLLWGTDACTNRMAVIVPSLMTLTMGWIKIKLWWKCHSPLILFNRWFSDVWFDWKSLELIACPLNLGVGFYFIQSFEFR
jgi:hypothetical protein